jgi:MSHA pilin protein MshD
MNKTLFPVSQGVTLIELIVSIVIISIAVSGIMSLYLGTSKSSADPMIRAQSLAIAQSYMDEIMMQAFVNPNGACPAIPGATRSLYNDVCDYNNLSDSGAADQNGNLITALAAYHVAVAVVQNSLQGIDAKKITVIVTHSDIGTSVPLVAYRTNY